MLAAAEAADAEEDETFGKDKRGDEMPDWAGDKQKRAGEDPAGDGGAGGGCRRLAAEEERRIDAKKEQQRQAEGRKEAGQAGRAAIGPTLIPSRNATSPIRKAAS